MKSFILIMALLTATPALSQAKTFTLGGSNSTEIANQLYSYLGYAMGGNDAQLSCNFNEKTPRAAYFTVGSVMFVLSQVMGLPLVCSAKNVHSLNTKLLDMCAIKLKEAKGK